MKWKWIFPYIISVISSLSVYALDLTPHIQKTYETPSFIAVTLDMKIFGVFSRLIERGRLKTQNKEHPYLLYWETKKDIEKARAYFTCKEQLDEAVASLSVKGLRNLYDHEISTGHTDPYYIHRKAFVVDRRDSIQFPTRKLNQPREGKSFHVVIWFSETDKDFVVKILAEYYGVFFPRGWIRNEVHLVDFDSAYENAFPQVKLQREEKERRQKKIAQKEEEQCDREELERKEREARGRALLVQDLERLKVQQMQDQSMPPPAASSGLYPELEDLFVEKAIAVPVLDVSPVSAVSPATQDIVPERPLAPKPVERKIAQAPLFGTRGLVNLGNTCFMNAVLQSLMKISPFVSYFQNRKMAFSHPLTEAFRLFVAEYGNGIKMALSPDKLSALRQVYFQDLSQGQQDAQEFLNLLLGILDEDQKGKEAVSFVQSMFGFYYQSTIFSDQSEHRSVKRDSSQCVTLQVPTEPVHIRRLFLSFMKEETLDQKNLYKYYPDEKNTKVFHFLNRKRIALIQDVLPEYLIVHLGRFSFGFGGAQKNHTKVDYSVGLSLGEAKYQLRSVLLHKGATSTSGHYYALVKEDGGGWYEANDEVVRGPLALDAVEGHPYAYILFYEKM